MRLMRGHRRLATLHLCINSCQPCECDLHLKPSQNAVRSSRHANLPRRRSLLFGVVNFTVNRWLDFLVNSHTMQARFHDIGVIVGSAVLQPDDMTVRKRLFRLYRYLNWVHALTYASVHPFLPSDLVGYISLGLATPSEVRLLYQMENKKRDCLITWVAGEIESLIRDGQLRELAVSPTLIPELRGICASPEPSAHSCG